MDKTKLTLLVLPLVALVGIPQVFALDSNNTYFLDDSEFISILIEVDSNGQALFEEVFITPEGGDKEFIMDSNSAMVVRITNDHSNGMIFGQTLDGDYTLVRFQTDGNDVHLVAKVWTDNGVERIITDGEVISLF